MENEGKKKSNLGLTILIIILMVVALVAGYFISEKGLFKTDKNTSNESVEKDSKSKKEVKKPVVTEYEVTDSKVVDLIPNLVKGLSCGIIEEFVSNSKVTASDITNVRAYIIAENSLSKAGKTEVSLDDYTKEIQKYLGKDYKFNPETVDYNGTYCPFYKYDSANKKFVKQETACGGECGPMTSYKVIKAVDTDGNLVLDLKVVFVSKDDYNYYADYNHTKYLATPENVNFDTIYDSGSTYKFTFKLEDGNYVFVSSELQK